MADEATLLVRIKTIIDKNSFTKNLKDISGKVKDSFATKSPVSDDSNDKSKKSGSSIGKGLQKGLGMVGKIFGVLKTATKWIGIIGLVMAAIEPAMKLFNGLVDMLKTFFQPISDMLTTLLMPILMMVRPIVQMFRVLMQPFRELAFKGLAAANTLISEGMGMKLRGEEGGGELVQEGFKGALSSASLLMKGFLEVIFSPLKNIEALGIGDAITRTFENWESKALEGIVRVDTLASTFTSFKEVLGDSSKAASDALEIIDNQMRKLKERHKTFNLDNIADVLDDAESIVKITSAGVKSDIDTIKAEAKKLNEPMSELVGYLEGGIDPANEFAKGLSKITNELDLTGFKSGKAESSLEGIEENKPSGLKTFMGGTGQLISDWWSGDLERNKAGIAQFGKSYNEGVAKVNEQWAKDSKKILKDYEDNWGKVPEEFEGSWSDMHRVLNKYLTNSLIPEGFEKGLKHMLKDTKNYYDIEKGRVVNTHSRGLKSIEDSTKRFVESLRTMSSTISRLADDAASSARKAANNARTSARLSRGN